MPDIFDRMRAAGRRAGIPEPQIEQGVEDLRREMTQPLHVAPGNTIERRAARCLAIDHVVVLAGAVAREERTTEHDERFRALDKALCVVLEELLTSGEPTADQLVALAGVGKPGTHVVIALSAL